jgi:hypothetical protein
MPDPVHDEPRASSGSEALPDAGEPQGADDNRPTMLGRRFRQTILTGSAVGLALAIGIHFLITQTVEDSTKFNGWSWAFAAIGGITVGGAMSLFIYGAATDRDDVGEHGPAGQADVSTQGEWRRTVNRRRSLRRRG